MGGEAASFAQDGDAPLMGGTKLRPLMWHVPFVMLCLLLLAGCQPGKEADGDPAKATDQDAEAEHVSLPDDPSGVWATSDDQGKPFDVVLFENGQAVSTGVQSSSGARGERALWRHLGYQVMLFFEDGRTATLSPGPGNVRLAGFPPGSRATSSPATNTADAQRVEDPTARFVGAWRLNREPDGSYLYLVLQSNGTAFSTVNGLTEGRWEVKNEAALCTWPDGWIDQISRASGAWHKKSWVGGEDGPPADLSTATRVGEVRFSITP